MVGPAHPIEQLSTPQARRIALAAQGFGRPAAVRPGTRQLRTLIARLGLLQLDSVNVFERSHYLPTFARLGAYEKADLDRLACAKAGPYVEYWANSNQAMMEWLLAEKGPLPASAIEHDANKRVGPWWGWSGVTS